MAFTYQIQAEEKAAIDPGVAGGPWTIQLPITNRNGAACTIKAITNDQTAVTVQALGTANLEDPTDPGNVTQTTTFSFRGTGSLTYTYNIVLNKWVIYETASILGALFYRDNWNGTQNYLPNDMVRHEGGLWICKIANTNVEPSYDEMLTTANWIAMMYPGSGSVNASVAQNIGTISAFTPIAFDTTVVSPFGCSFNPSTEEFTYNFPGIWQTSMNLFFEHDSSNQGRSLTLRLWNVTDSTAIGSVTIGIGRNVTDSNTSLSLLDRIGAADLDDALRWEIGPGAGSVSSVNITAFSFNLLQGSI